MKKKNMRWTVSKRKFVALSLILVFVTMIFGVTSQAQAEPTENSNPGLSEVTADIRHCSCSYENYTFDVQSRCEGNDVFYTGVSFSNSGYCKPQSNCYAPQNRSPMWVDCSECGFTRFGTGLYGDVLEWRVEDQCTSLPGMPVVYGPNWE